jgi:flagellar motor switch protein FliG
MSAAKKYKGFDKALSAVKSLPIDKQKVLIQQLIKKDPELATQLTQGLFSFLDLPQLAKSDFKILWFEIPRQKWLLALRGASDELLLFVRSCQTERAFNELIKELKLIGPQPASQVAKAQNELLNEVYEFAKQGRIHLPNRR